MQRRSISKITPHTHRHTRTHTVKQRQAHTHKVSVKIKFAMLLAFVYAASEKKRQPGAMGKRRAEAWLMRSECYISYICMCVCIYTYHIYGFLFFFFLGVWGTFWWIVEEDSLVRHVFDCLLSSVNVTLCGEIGRGAVTEMFWGLCNSDSLVFIR